MSYVSEDFENVEPRGIGDDAARRIDGLLAALMDEDLSEWEADFVTDMATRLHQWRGDLVVTARQQEQLNRMENQYGVRVRTAGKAGPQLRY